MTNFLHHAYVIVWLLVVTAANRTGSLRTLAAFWLAGIFPVFGLAVLVAGPPAGVLGIENGFVSVLWVPLTEELLKALPVAIYFALFARGGSWQRAASDGVLLGWMVGWGFAFYEDAVVGQISGNGLGGAAPWSILFPTIYVEEVPNLGHAGWTALVGLALGLASLYRHVRWSAALPIGALAIVVLDHMSINAGAGLLRDLLGVVLLGGLLPIVLLLGGVAVTLVLEQRILRPIGAADPAFPAIPIRDVARRLPMLKSVALLLRLQALREYLRRRRSAHYTLWRWRFTTNRTDARLDELFRGLFSGAVAAGVIPRVPAAATSAPHDAGQPTDVPAPVIEGRADA